MFKTTLRALTIVLLGIFVVACSSGASDEAEETTDSDTSAEIAEEAPTQETTDTEDDIVVAEPTAVASGETPSEDVIIANVERADEAAGETLYNEELVPTCITCHLVDSSQRAVGPSLVGFSEIAGSRVEGQGAYTYAYNSIRYANMHVVDGYVEGVMPVYDGILTDQEVYELIAYIWTLDAE